jgi:transcriptional regulator with XRE-family HTH domain
MNFVQHGIRQPNARVVDEFNADIVGAPFKVILRNSVQIIYDQKTGEIEDYHIPDYDGLLRAIVLNRVLHSRKLSGADIKFLRKCIGLKAKELCKKIGVTSEHMSRLENNNIIISPASEKLMRLFMFKTALKLSCMKSEEKRIKLEEALDSLFDDVKPVACHDVEEELVLCLHRPFNSPKAANDEGPGFDPCWDAPKVAYV